MGISETTWATEIVYLSKFAEFHEDLNGHAFNIATQLQIIMKCQKMISKCTCREVHYANRAYDVSQPCFSASYNLKPIGTLIDHVPDICSVYFNFNLFFRDILFTAYLTYLDSIHKGLQVVVSATNLLQVSLLKRFRRVTLINKNGFQISVLLYEIGIHEIL